MREESDPGTTARFAPLLALLGGALLVAFSLVSWGTTDEGIAPSVSGLGRMSVPGAPAEDVAFFEEHTLRPGLTTVFAGAVVMITAALLWWRRGVFWPAMTIIGLGGATAVAVGAVVIADPADALFDDLVNAEFADDGSLLSPGYGVVGVTVVGAVVLLVAIVAVVDRLRRRDQRRPETTSDNAASDIGNG